MRARAVGAPPGFLYAPDAIDESEEAALLARFDPLAFEEVRMRGAIARRRVLHFGFRYAYESGALAAGDPIPEWLGPLRERAAALAGVAPGALGEVLVTRYPPGAGIGWHRDAPAFERVVGVSLRAACVMRLRRERDGVREEHRALLAPRSAYVLSGAARWHWQHHVPPIAETRYSITFRTLRAHVTGTPRGAARG
ncbi:MAG: hypothetical protein DCC71_05730 [Proteobacteria bacterium]|nr:MAG: hypothetical protein DCC71_05730 [Pseudomonadota bacterium]